MLNPIVEMRRLHCKSYHELMQIAITNYGFCPDGKNVSKVELITYIIALAVMSGEMDPMASQENKNDNKRTRFIFDNDGATYHVMLTKEQVDFMDWCLDHEINFYNIDIREALDIDWEKP